MGSKDPRVTARISFFRAKRELYMRGWVTCENLEYVTGAKAPWVITRNSFFRAKRELYMRGW
ncbi:MAG: hypothetical protein A2847_01380 [Candidatus Sungbacteria bacterium RIFCSPHIGHO2_01_FULL_50_25]|uniref:Uncharacterized protein n=1 Tax=Candidatus Sungbacteria bacterium RIFCSPHIGHO2_01_FULL_50_25 TaxID=1802265 RepID=A0A1G2K966_9BACT|nr:MAG: hypothetical protein A2847_01380 [Candidatus Sungbacteria bacterium RIFCSPHIGHO2_01_FULL_50_25]